MSNHCYCIVRILLLSKVGIMVTWLTPKTRMLNKISEVECHGFMKGLRVLMATQDMPQGSFTVRAVICTLSVPPRPACTERQGVDSIVISHEMSEHPALRPTSGMSSSPCRNTRSFSQSVVPAWLNPFSPSITDVSKTTLDLTPCFCPYFVFILLSQHHADIWPLL